MLHVFYTAIVDVQDLSGIRTKVYMPDTDWDFDIRGDDKILVVMSVPIGATMMGIPDEIVQLYEMTSDIPTLVWITGGTAKVGKLFPNWSVKFGEFKKDEVKAFLNSD